MCEYRHTIFTPVYNRANQISDVYKSICEMNYNRERFEWLIVDDGSTDNLFDVISNFDSDKYNIRCIKKENGGIHTAQNLAVKMAKGEYFTRIDSDDYILPNALSSMDFYLDLLAEDPAYVQWKGKIAGVVGLCLNKSDNTVRGTEFPEKMAITTGIELRKKGAFGDRNYCIKTSIMQDFLIPEFEATKWVPEGIIWRRIDRKYKTCFVNVPLSVCSEANENSMLGQSGKCIWEKSSSNCMSAYYACLFAINENARDYNIDGYLKQHAILWVHILKCKKKSILKVIGEIKGIHKIISMLMILPSTVYLQMRKH